MVDGVAGITGVLVQNLVVLENPQEQGNAIALPLQMGVTLV